LLAHELHRLPSLAHCPLKLQESVTVTFAVAWVVSVIVAVSVKFNHLALVESFMYLRKNQ